jgi:serine/threonine protein kinase/tetratricopeptide (TPR) repeat protein
VRCLGRGASGTVYLATHETLARSVAIKFLRRELSEDPGQRDRLRAEARLLAGLRHPSLVGVHDMGQAADGRTYFVMEYVDGATLRELLDQRKRWPIPEACEMVAQALDGLAVAHEHGVVHRDVKPSNLLVGADGKVRLLDFGVAKELRPDVNVESTQEGQVVGTPRYMSPEQACGDPVSAASDLYAAGCVLFEMITGTPPYGGASAAELLQKHVMEPSPALSERFDGEVDTSLEAVVAQALAKDPTERPRSARAMAADLRRIARGADSNALAGTMEIPASKRSRVGNLRELSTKFFGREGDITRLAELYATGDRLVTLLGPGGAGKTRLAIRFASSQSKAYAPHGGTWFIDLTEAADEGDVVTRIARALEIRPRGPDPRAEIAQVAQVLSTWGPTLLILDNCEQVASPVAELVAELLQAAPEARFVATSRERLRIGGERSYELEPLALPPEDGDEVDAAAVQLFLDRARLVRPGFSPNEQEQRLIGRVVRALDGMPLGIELAAGRMGLMSVGTLFDRLDKRFEILASSIRGVPKRQATLQAAIDGSWDLLEPCEQAALQQCAVFRGGFTIEAAEAVIDLTDHPAAPPVLELIQRLRDKSLVYVAASSEFSSELRLGLYESIREYAAKRLFEAGELDRACGRHTAHFLATGEEWASAVEVGSTEHLRRLVLDLENLQAMHAWAKRGPPRDRLRSVVILDAVHARRSSAGVQLDLLTSTLGSVGPDADPVLVATLLLRRWRIWHGRGDNKSMEEDAGRALELARQAGHRVLEGEALWRLAIVAMRTGAHAQRLLDDSLAAFRAVGDQVGDARALTRAAIVYVSKGRPDQGRDAAQRAVFLAETGGDAEAAADARLFLGVALMELGELLLATRAWQESRAAFARLGNNVRNMVNLLNLATVHQELGDLAEAERLHRELIATAPEYGMVSQRGIAQAALGALHAARDEVDEAKQLLDEAGVVLAPLWDVWASVVSVHAGHLDLALARRAARAGDSAMAAVHRASAARRLAEARVKASTSDDLRTALRWLERALELGATERYPSDAWFFTNDGAWFRPPRGWRIEVGARRQLRAILSALLRARTSAPGTALSTSEVLDAGWPGERVLPRAGVARVYTAIKTLRDLGLREVLLSSDDGYFIDPAQPVVVSET